MAWGVARDPGVNPVGLQPATHCARRVVTHDPIVPYSSSELEIPHSLRGLGAKAVDGISVPEWASIAHNAERSLESCNKVPSVPFAKRPPRPREVSRWSRGPEGPAEAGAVSATLSSIPGSAKDSPGVNPASVLLEEPDARERAVSSARMHLGLCVPRISPARGEFASAPPIGSRELLPISSGFIGHRLLLRKPLARDMLWPFLP